jgi:hypothetical protein
MGMSVVSFVGAVIGVHHPSSIIHHPSSIIHHPKSADARIAPAFAGFGLPLSRLFSA